MLVNLENVFKNVNIANCVLRVNSLVLRLHHYYPVAIATDWESNLTM